MKTYYYLKQDTLGLPAGTLLKTHHNFYVRLMVDEDKPVDFRRDHLPPEIGVEKLGDPVLVDQWELDDGQQPRLTKTGDVACYHNSDLPAGRVNKARAGRLRYIIRRKAQPEPAPEPEEDGDKYVRYPIYDNGGWWSVELIDCRSLSIASDLVGFDHILTEKGKKHYAIQAFRADDPPMWCVCRKGGEG